MRLKLLFASLFVSVLLYILGLLIFLAFTVNPKYRNIIQTEYQDCFISFSILSTSGATQTIVCPSYVANQELMRDYSILECFAIYHSIKYGFSISVSSQTEQKLNEYSLEKGKFDFIKEAHQNWNNGISCCDVHDVGILCD